MMSRFPGRKSVVLFSEGLAVSPRLDGLLALAQDGNVTFYTIDASGPQRRRPEGAAPQRDRPVGAHRVEPDQAPASWQKSFPEMDPTAGLGPLADRTGGFYVSDTNDLKAALSAVDADRRAFYVLAYASRRETGDDASRHLEVRVKRPGVSVRARSGVVDGGAGVTVTSGWAPRRRPSASAAALDTATRSSRIRSSARRPRPSSSTSSCATRRVAR